LPESSNTVVVIRERELGAALGECLANVCVRFRAILVQTFMALETMPLHMADRKFAGTKYLQLATTLVMLIFATSARAEQSGAHRPLPRQVASKAPGIHPFGKGRHTVWGIRVYDATLWIVGPQWSADAPHALEIEPGRAVPASTLVTTAIAEMRDLGVGDENSLKLWQAEMRKVIPNLQKGDQAVIFCPATNRTLVYLNNSNVGTIDDPSFCPAVMSVWLHPQTKHQAIRKSLLRQ
jgi:hypothetical protein